VTGSERRPARIAVDLLGGDNAPAVVVDGVIQALGADPFVSVLLAGPVDVAQPVVARFRDRVALLPATDTVAMADPPALAVRAKRDSTIRVAVRAVADGVADAAVSVGSTGAVLSAALLDLGRLPGVDRPALAVIIPAHSGPVVLLDVGAGVVSDVSLLTQHAALGSAYASIELELPVPRVALLSTGAETGKGGPIRRAAAERLGGSALTFVGNVEAHMVPLGGAADVVVTDGFAGNVLLKGIEGTLEWVRRAAPSAPRPDAVRAALLLGVPATIVVGHGAAESGDVAGCIHRAAEAVRRDTVRQLSERFSALTSVGRQVDHRVVDHRDVDQELGGRSAEVSAEVRT
jgi:glycerol-3-phosphate acyltransferase PlsX